MEIISPSTTLYQYDIVYEPSTHRHYIILSIVGSLITLAPLTYWGQSSQLIQINRSTMNGKLVLIQVPRG